MTLQQTLKISWNNEEVNSVFVKFKNCEYDDDSDDNWDFHETIDYIDTDAIVVYEEVDASTPTFVILF